MCEFWGPSISPKNVKISNLMIFKNYFLSFVPKGFKGKTVMSLAEYQQLIKGTSIDKPINLMNKAN